MMAIDTAQENGASLKRCCEVAEIGARTIQRWRKDPEAEDMRMGPKTEPKSKYSKSERKWVLEIMNLPEYRDKAPSQIVPQLADLGIYVSSESSMYRFARGAQQDAHRGKKRAPCKVSKPTEKIATGPGQLYSWDITYLRGPIHGKFFYLYMVVDIWSRKIVGHVVHENENSELAATFMKEVYLREGSPDGLTVHQDNGAPMKGSTLVATLEALQIHRSYSRPSVSNDNPVSESLFGTMKTRPEYPSKPFEDIAAAKAWVDAFVRWYNEEHLHSSIGFVTPNQRHSGQSEKIHCKRRRVYEEARQRMPSRWSGETRKWQAPDKVYLNPDKATLEQLKN